MQLPLLPPPPPPSTLDLFTDHLPSQPQGNRHRDGAPSGPHANAILRLFISPKPQQTNKKGKFGVSSISPMFRYSRPLLNAAKNGGQYGGYKPPHVNPVYKTIGTWSCAVMWAWLFYRFKEDGAVLFVSLVLKVH